MYKWFLAWRYLHTKLIAFFGIASVMLCVAMVLVVMSVMGGFLDTIRARSKGLHSEIVLEGGNLQGFPCYAEFSEYLGKELPNVARLCTPVIYTYGIFRVPATTETKPVRVLGIRLAEYVQVNDFGKGLYYNRYYPGTTHLGPQRMPVAGFTEQGDLKLPEELEAANSRWRAGANAKDIADYLQHPYEKCPYPFVTPPVPSDRVFAVSTEAPAYTDAEHDGIIVGADVLFFRRADGNFDRHLARGADLALNVLPLGPTGNPLGEPPVVLPLRYADDSRTGIYEIDSMCVYVDVDMLQHKLAMDPQPLIDGGFTRPRVNQLLVGLQPGVDLDEAKARIADAWSAFTASQSGRLSENDGRALDFVNVYTWEDLQRPFIAAVEKEKVLVTFLFALISIVAIALVGCIFYMIVEKKTKDIGVLKALGASGRGVAGMFILYAGAVGITGAILGTLVGSLFVWNINDIQDLLAQLNPQLRVWNPEIYSFDRIPEVVKRADALWVNGVAVLATMIGSLIPAALAGRVWPVQALRYE